MRLNNTLEGLTKGSQLDLCEFILVSLPNNTITDEFVDGLISYLREHNEISVLNIKGCLFSNQRVLDRFSDFVARNSSLKTLKIGEHMKSRRKHSSQIYCSILKALTESGRNLPLSIHFDPFYVSTKITPEVIDALCLALEANKISGLNLQSCKMTTQQLSKLSESMSACSNLQFLNLAAQDKNSIKPILRNLINALLDKDRLAELDLGFCNNDLDDDDLAVISQLYLKESSRLNSLNLMGFSITDRGINTISQILRSSAPVRSLVLDSKKISDTGLSQLLDSITSNTKLLKIELPPIKVVSEETCRKLGECITTNTHIRILTLNGLALKDKAVHVLNALGENRSLRHISLQSAGITDKAITSSRNNLLANKTLNEFEINYNRISPSHYNIFIEMASSNTNLCSLGFVMDPSSADAQRVHTLTQSNSNNITPNVNSGFFYSWYNDQEEKARDELSFQDTISNTISTLWQTPASLRVRGRDNSPNILEGESVAKKLRQ